MSVPWGMNRSRAAWWSVGVVLAGAVVFVLYSFVGTFVFGVFLYYATRPLYRRLRPRVRPASLAAASSLLLLALPVVLLFAYTTAIALQEFNRLSRRRDFGQVEALLGPYLDISRIPETPREFLTAPDSIAIVGRIAEQASAYLGFLGLAALHAFVMIAIAFYLLRDGGRLARWLHRNFADDADVFGTYFRAVDRNFHQVFFGNILNAVLTATIGAISYNLLNFASSGLVVPYPTLVGLLAGAASLVPVVGMKLVYVPVTAYLGGVALLSGDPDLLWFPGAFALVSFVVVDTIPDLVLRPYVSGRSLHVGMVMFAYIFGPLLFGWYGIFLGPMLLVLVIQFARLVLPELLAGEPIRPVAVDPTHLVGPGEEE